MISPFYDGHIYLSPDSGEGSKNITTKFCRMPNSYMRKRAFLPVCLVLLSFTIGCSSGRNERKISANNRNEPASKLRKSSTQANLETKTLTGLVIGIMDGDTIELLDDQRTSYRIRLKGIDAPEKRQAFGKVSRENLAVMLAGKVVTIEWQKYDRNGRIVGKILADGRDVCLEQIKVGLAWHYKDFEEEQSEADRQLYSEAESEARSQKLGLWRESSQIPPWDFRHKKKVVFDSRRNSPQINPDNPDQNL